MDSTSSGNKTKYWQVEFHQFVQQRKQSIKAAENIQENFSYASDRGLVSRVYKEPKTLNIEIGDNSVYKSAMGLKNKHSQKK